ncbi:MAG: ATP-dependent protease [Rickettsia endosymbiont of Bryobia graminum]|nr:ATP-dependent protease [Rickettsia endosymbiont of Bryobia graminum]
MSKKPLVLGISGPKLTNDERELLVKNKIEGFILFKRNIVDSEQLTLLIKDLRGLYDYKILILIDQEGGRVARLKPPIIEQEYPAVSSFGELYDKDPGKACAEVFVNYESLMKSLKDYDIDSPCAPVVDLRYTYTDNVIGNRSFGSSVQKVVDLAKAAIKGIEARDGIAIPKHIPGHGRATCDSHYKLPIITTGLDELNITDFKVFRQLAGTNYAMTAHIIFEALDSRKPVTISKKSIDFIRNNIGFKGLLVTDDICMLALHGDVGAKYSLLKKPLNIFESNQTIGNEDLEQLVQHGIIKDKSDQVGLKIYLQEEFPKLKEQFVESVVSVAKQSFYAGCEIILHCSSDLDEMTALCKEFS